MAVTTKDNTRFDIDLTGEQYRLLLEMLGCATAMAELTKDQRYIQFWELAKDLVDVKVAMHE